MAKNPESPIEPFKRALANAARSLAESPDLEIVYSGEGPALQGNRAVLPHPPRDLRPSEAARIRGLADQMALRIAHHDVAQHAKGRPKSAIGGPVFDAIEQARIEAIGANALGGVRANLNAVLEAAVAKRGFNKLEDLANPPMPEILSLMVRERLTGDAPPAAVAPLVDHFRAEIERKAGADLDQLLEKIEDQKAFQRIARTIVRDLSMSDDLTDAPEQPDDEEEGQEGDPSESETDEGEGEEQGP
ncbi:MAG: cobaltochelatase subunit CobT, partial [Caulobacteraceae bacterium]|nr:cobaltochelatase subunit CobT [Caulobacteraceae bacterium]